MREQMKPKYKVFSACLGKFTATNNARRRHYRVFDTREEAQRWADEQNSGEKHVQGGNFPIESRAG